MDMNIESDQNPSLADTNPTRAPNAETGPLYPEEKWKLNDTSSLISESDAQAIPSNTHGRGSKPTWRTPLGQLTIGWSTAQMLIIVILEAVVLSIHNDEIAWIQDVATNQTALLTQIIPNEKAVTLYHAIYVAAQVFQFVFALDAVVSSSTIQLISTTIFNWVLTIYAFVQYWQTRTLANQATAELAQNGVKTSLHWSVLEEFMIIGIMIVFALGWIYLTTKLHRQFGWSIFKELGADVATKSQLKLYHIFLMLLKVDVFFFNGFTIQYLVLVLLGNAEKATILFQAFVVTPCTIPMLILAYYAIRRESKFLMITFLLILVGGTGYVISRLMDIFTTNNPNKYLASKSSLSLFESIVIVLAIVTVVVGYLNLRNFGAGLQDQLRGSARESSGSSTNRLKKPDSTAGMFKWDSRQSPLMPYHIMNNMDTSTTPSAISIQMQSQHQQFQKQSTLPSQMWDSRNVQAPAIRPHGVARQYVTQQPQHMHSGYH